jgi:hypothetical protein
VSRRPGLFVTVREPKLLLRGEEAERTARLLADGSGPAWSRRGRGWVLESDRLPDVLAFASTGHILAVVSDESRRTDTSGAA